MKFDVGFYTYYSGPGSYVLTPSLWPDPNGSVKNYDHLLRQSLEKILREHGLSNSCLCKEFLRSPQLKSKIKPILDQEPVLSTHFSKEKLEQLPLLWIAILGCYERSAELLVQSGADVNELFGSHDPQLIDEKWTVLHLLLHMHPYPENERLIHLVMDHGADFQAQDYAGRKVLHYAAKHNRLVVTNMLLKKGADVNAADDEGMTPLFFSVSGNKMILKELVLLLIKHGADLQVREHTKGRTILHYAVKEGRVSLVEMLLENGADVNAADNDGKTPLLVALASGSEAIKLVPLLVEHGANVSVKDRKGMNALHCLSFMDPKYSGDLATFLIEKGTSLDDYHLKEQPIHQAVSLGRDELVKLFLDHGANVNALSAREKESPLHMATECSRNPEVILEILLKRGANINLKTIEGRTPLHTACQYAAYRSYECQHDSENLADDYNGLNVIRQLLSAGADVFAEDNEGKTPLALITSISEAFKIELGDESLPLVEMLALKKALQPSIELKDEMIIQRYQKLLDHYRKCIDEINWMKSLSFIETCTFFELFMKSQCQINALMENPEFESKFRLYDLNDEFPIYAGDILRAFECAEKGYRAMVEQANLINRRT